MKISKSWFFEKICKIHKPLSRFTKKKRERTHTKKIGNERGEITSPTKIQKKKKIQWTIIYQQIGQPKRNRQTSRKIQSAKIFLNQEETDNLNRLITSSEIDFVIKKTNKKKTPKQK